MHRPQDRQYAAILCTFIGGVYTLAGISLIWRGWRTGGWKPAPGEITDAFVSEDKSGLEEGQGGSDYWPQVFYKYTVHGKEYEGNTVQRGIFRVPFRYFAEKQVGDYRPGQRLTVYYLPSDPSQAVLRRGAPMSAFVALVIGLLLIYVGYRIL